MAKRGVSHAEAALLAALAEGRPGYALALDARATVARRDRVAAWCTALRRDRRKAIWSIAAELEAEDDLPGWLGIMATWFRDVWHTSLGRGLDVANVDKLPVLEQEAARWGGAAGEAIWAITGAGRHLAQNANKRLVLEVMLMKIQRGLPCDDRGSGGTFPEGRESILL